MKSYFLMFRLDIKPSNVFLTLDAAGKTIVKIGDFGLSYELVKSKSRASSKAGTVVYWPPEVFAGEAPGKPAGRIYFTSIFSYLTHFHFFPIQMFIAWVVSFLNCA
jgi:serine/threonine protein kinase